MFPSDVSKTDLGPQRHAALLGMADIVCLRQDPGELFRKLAPHLRSVLSFYLLTFAVGDSLQRIMKMYWWEGSQWLHGPLEVPVEESLAGSVWRNQSVACVENLTVDKQFEPELQWLREQEIQSYCVLPLTNFREKLGALGFGSKQTHGFDHRDLHFLGRVAEMVALCIDATLADETRAEEVGRLRLLLEVGGPDARGSDLQQSVASILGSMQKWAMQAYVGVYLYDEISQSLRLHTPDVEMASKLAPHGLTPIEGTLAGQAFRSRRSMVLDHSSLAGLPFESVKRVMELGVRSLYLSPLVSAKGPLGVLKVARREDQAFGQRDIELLEKVAATVATVLDRSGTDNELKTKQAKIEGTKTDPGQHHELCSSAVAGPVGQPRGIIDTVDREPPSTGSVVSFSAPEALMESEQLLAAYFKASRVGLGVLDTDFRYLLVNDTLAEMNGVPAAKHLGHSVRDILGDFAELIEPQFRQVLATGQPIADLELSFMLPTRTEAGHWIEHYIPIKDATGKVKQIGVIVVEVTEQKKLEESLRGVSERLRQEKKRHEVLMEVSRLLASKWDVREVFPQISAYLRRVLRQEYAALALHDEKTGQLLPQAIDFPLGKNKSVGGEIGTAKGPGGKALQDRASLILSGAELQGLDPGIAANLTSEGLKSLCCVPLLRPKGPLGVLILGSTRTDAFHTDDLTLLNQVSAQLAIALENARSAREVEQLKQRLKQERHYMEGEPRAQLHFEEIIGESAVLKRVLDQIAIISASDATVLILGETGTGKGLVARAIHRTSKRKGRNFITLNCAAIPTGLLESELFGHEKGAFTGAVSQKIGRLELADQGTLFLDEIGEIPLEMQPKLLRVLQDHEFERLGGTRTIKVDLRLIAATNRDLAKSIAQKQFRSDLFYRLNVFPIRLPSLRERRDDIPLLVRYFVRKFASRKDHQIETIPNETMDELMKWHWPGNLRELENFIERSVILTEGTALRAPLAEFHAETAGTADPSLEATEREAIIRVLREAGGVIAGPTGAARRLGLKRTTLQSKMQRLGITREDYLGKKPK
jgi:formate hydrogenlyase transcriptional activator